MSLCTYMSQQILWDSTKKCDIPSYPGGADSKDWGMSGFTDATKIVQDCSVIYVKIII